MQGTPIDLHTPYKPDIISEMMKLQRRTDNEYNNQFLSGHVIRAQSVQVLEHPTHANTLAYNYNSHTRFHILSPRKGTSTINTMKPFLWHRLPSS